jgi:hypothetical protein
VKLPRKVIASIKLPVDSRAIGLIVLALAKEWPEVEMRKAGEFMDFFIEEDAGDDHHS